MIAKRTLLQIHRWSGLVIAAFLLVQSVTGAMLVFRNELAQLTDPSGMVRHSATGQAPLSRIVASVRAVYPDFELQRIVFPQIPRATYFVHLVNAQGVVRYASVDPGSGEVLRSGGIWRFPTEAALLIHYQLMAGRVGLVVILCLGVSLTVMVVTGAAYWWPRSGRWRRSLEINWRMPGRVVLRQCHRALGPLALLVLGTTAVTGVVLAAGLLIGGGDARSTSPSGQLPVADTNIDPAFALARTRFPDRGVRDLRMPAPGRFNLFFWAPERQPEAVHGVRIELQSLKVAAVVRAEADNSLSTFVLPIHTGESGSWAGRLIILAGGLALALLAVTGPLMWLQARPRGRQS